MGDTVTLPETKILLTLKWMGLEDAPFLLGRFLWPILRGKLAVRFREGSFLGFGGAEVFQHRGVVRMADWKKRHKAEEGQLGMVNLAEQ